MSDWEKEEEEEEKKTCRERERECRLHGGVMNDTSLGSHSSICPSLPPSLPIALFSSLLSFCALVPTSWFPFLFPLSFSSFPPLFSVLFYVFLIFSFFPHLSVFHLHPSFPHFLLSSSLNLPSLLILQFSPFPFSPCVLLFFLSAPSAFPNL